MKGNPWDSPSLPSVNMAEKEGSGDSGTGTSSSSNPLSRKLNKILETRLDNDKVE